MQTPSVLIIEDAVGLLHSINYDDSLEQTAGTLCPNVLSKKGLSEMHDPWSLSA